MNFISLKQLRRLRGSEQVAAVCYQISKRGLEFLLVRTRHGRWTFPKDDHDADIVWLFARYIRIKPGRDRHAPQIEIVMNAHLCEVSRLAAPQEADRNPTWFSAEKAKRKLREDRAADYGDDLARIVDRAVARIQRFYRDTHRAPAVVRRAEIIEIDNPPLIPVGMKLLGKKARRSRL